jgi:hypothetical protein
MTVSDTEVRRVRTLVAGHEAGHALVAWHYKRWPLSINIDVSVTTDGRIKRGGETLRSTACDRDVDVAISVAGFVANTDLQGVARDEAKRCAYDDFAELCERYPATEGWLPGFTNSRLILSDQNQHAPWVRLRDTLIDASENGNGWIAFSTISRCIIRRILTLRCHLCRNVVDMDRDPYLRQLDQGDLLCGRCAIASTRRLEARCRVGGAAWHGASRMSALRVAYCVREGSSNQDDVPFDLRHIRVILYDQTDPFWGQKLIDKVADNIRSAISDPEDAIFKVEETPA